MTENRPPVSENLRALKERAGVPWREIAEAADVNQRQLEEWARPTGRYLPSWENLGKLAAYFTSKLGVAIDRADFYVDPEGE